MPNRHGQSASYRYGFQGQEKDDEVKGEGNSLNYTFRMHDPRAGRFFAIDPLAEHGPEYSPYSFCFNNPMHFTDPDGRWPFPSWASVKSQYREAKATVSRAYNETKSTVSRSYNQAKTSLVQAKDNAVKTTKQALNDGQKWVKDNKQGLLKTAEVLKTAGDVAVYTGGVVAVGTAATGVGVGVGGAIAGYGELIGLAGSGIEMLTLAIAGDTENSKGVAKETAGWFAAGKVADVIIDAAIPGNVPDISEEAAKTMKAGSEVLKATVGTSMTTTQKIIDKE